MTRWAVSIAAFAAAIVPAPAEGDAGCHTHACRARVAEHHWRHLRFKLPPATKVMLARLRACESTGNYRASNGVDWGAYQYAWGPGSAGARAGFRVRPDRASPAEQDVRTARFYPSHRGEWECRA